MKIAVVTDDGKTICQHFGRASYYLVATVGNGRVTATELREKPGHRQFSQEPKHEEHHHGPVSYTHLTLPTIYSV